MIRKIGACLMAFAVAVSFSPVTAEAASSKAQKQKIQKFWKQLKKLPNRAAPFGKTKNLAKKLTKLDPKKTNKYFKTALKKFPIVQGTETGKRQASLLGSDLSKIVKKVGPKAGMTDKKIAKVQSQMQKEVARFPTPTPTPSPYQASILRGAVCA